MTPESDFMACHEFQGIPYSEKIVVFPNFHTVVLQHLQLHPDKICFQDGENPLTYRHLSEGISALMDSYEREGIKSGDRASLPFSGDGASFTRLLAMWNMGIVVQIHFTDRPSSGAMPEPNGPAFEERPIPYLTLDRPACRFESPVFGPVHFSAYNILAAAQSLGRVFHLFRDGDTLVTAPPATLSDLMLSYIVPYFWGKTIHFRPLREADPAAEFENGHVQYAYIPDMNDSLMDAVKHIHPEKLLRDAVLLTRGESSALPDLSWIRAIRQDDHFFGMGPVFETGDKPVPVPALEIVRKSASELYLKGPSLFDRFENGIPENFYGRITPKGFRL